jgi:hypothetical protein
MKRLLAIGAVAVFAMLLFLLHALHAPVDAAPAATASTAPAPMKTAVAIAPTSVLSTPPPAPAAEDDGKVNVNSDDFFDRYVERQPKVVSRAAMSCYRGGLDRRTMDQYITIAFVGHIKDGEATFTDVKAKDSHLDDKTLEDCMIASVAQAHFHDDSLPDVAEYADTTTLTPERGGKKYMRHDDDGPAAPADTPR